MNTSELCPCCSGKLIHHLSHHRDYWFCRSCWQEMPLVDLHCKIEESTNNGKKEINNFTHISQLN